MTAKKILIGIPPKNHIILAKDELDGLRELGYHCDTITYTRNNQSISKLNKFWGVLTNAIALVHRLHKFRPEILYLNSRFEPVGATRDFITFLCMRLFYHKKIKVVIKSHGSNFDIFKSSSFFFKDLVLPFLIKRVDVWWFLSQDEKKSIEEYHPEMGVKSIVTSNIIDAGRSIKSVDFLKNYGLSDTKFSFLFVGRMVKEKGLFSMLKAIPFFSQKDDCQFIFVGDGDDLDEIKILTKKLELEEFVNFLGFIPEEECDHFYANTDVLIFPSHDEGFAMALFKAVASGMAIITTRIRAAKDQLRAPDNCLWVEIASEQSIANALSHIYSDERLRKTMSKNNRLLGQRYARQSLCKEMHLVFSSLL